MTRRPLPLFPLALLGMVLASIFSFWLVTGSGVASTEVGGPSGTPSYLPLIRYDPTPPPPVPQFVKNVALPDAQCPNHIAVNPVSGVVYVPNNYSFNTSVLFNRTFIGNIGMGEWPNLVAADNDSPYTYITVLHDKTLVFSGTTKIGHIQDYHEPFAVAVNPVNGHAYITDLDSTVQVAHGAILLEELYLNDPDGHGAGWLRSLVIDDQTGLVYVASWEFGKLYTISGTSVVGQPVQLGWGVIDMAIDSERGYLYAANDDPNETYPQNISVYNLNTGVITRIATADRSERVALDQATGYAYFTNDQANTVTVVRGTEVVANITVGVAPFGVAVNPNTGYVAVANQGSNNISILREGALVTTVAAQGVRPYEVDVDVTNNDFYIANRGDEYALYQCQFGSVTILH